ncbi:type I-E CRISPR-associated protein Cas7/Cse4/CasC [Skermanella aerolata]|uniref:Type I-E CRISPR-associated protein Cas7/Cse4/CasC n=1 Tax=Skermanella aerolata TaxID=393310 RepID=A0A512E0P0_9PROT|nr:type I-E CRISPR-associated protein Cas7/Cse4/CasC [Skermanella aerolata]KJB91502.1 CRISPR-associated protein Cse4 [Skermanella aerolata KACC 11604]GEO42303.1 type I-E CRISPR-associated protein Cas7/Cse4/CasC [Skermanella aerolata]
MSVEPRFLQIHALTPYVAALLNRDDVGRAKRLPFGGAERTRVSSQCLKRHWRRAVDEWSFDQLGVPLAVRSRITFRKEIAEPLIAEGLPSDVVVTVVAALQAKLLGASAKAEKERSQKKGRQGEGENSSDLLERLDTNQVIVLGRPEIEFIKNAARDLAHDATAVKDATKAAETYVKENRANLEALSKASGLDGALFGRMVTSDYLARGDAAVHVAHAFTVHGEEAEPDYFTAVDDLRQSAGEMGSGLIATSELTSGLFYVYVVVDVRLLVSNLEGCDARGWHEADRDLASSVVEHLIHLIASVSPGAKRGSTAPYGYAELMMIEAGARQPRSLANAFLRPVSTRGDLRANAFRGLGEHLAGFDRMYGRRELRRFASIADPGALPADPAEGLDALAAWAAGLVRDGGDAA